MSVWLYLAQSNNRENTLTSSTVTQEAGVGFLKQCAVVVIWAAWIKHLRAALCIDGPLCAFANPAWQPIVIN